MTTISMGSAPIINGYLRHLRTRRCSRETLRTVRSILHKLSTDLAGVDLLRVTADQLAEWQAERTDHIAARTMRTYCSYITCFYRWAILQRYLDVDPSSSLVTPKVPRLLPRPIDEDRLQLALDNAAPDLLVILGLAGFAGLRACEIAGLDWSEVTLHGDAPCVRVLGKGGRERIVDLSPELVRVLARLSYRRGPVIRRRDGSPGRVSANRISSFANRYLRALGIDDTLHSLRHRFGTVTCRLGGLRVAQEALGHVSPTNTAGYAQVAIRDLRPVVIAAGRIQPVNRPA